MLGFCSASLSLSPCLSLSLPSENQPVKATISLASLPDQESGRETPSAGQASSINGTDDEKISHVGPEAAVLKSENERLKSEVEQRYKATLLVKHVPSTYTQVFDEATFIKLKS